MTKPKAISEELDRRARRVWGKLLPGETHTAKIRNALTPLVLLTEGHTDPATVTDSIIGLRHTLDHLAAVDKERYELLLAIDDLKNNINILGIRVREIERLERRTDEQSAKRQAALELLGKAIGEYVLPDFRASGDVVEFAQKMADAIRERMEKKS
jgi:hypothetical protein